MDWIYSDSFLICDLCCRYPLGNRGNGIPMDPAAEPYGTTGQSQFWTMCTLFHERIHFMFNTGGKGQKRDMNGP